MLMGATPFSDRGVPSGAQSYGMGCARKTQLVETVRFSAFKDVEVCEPKWGFAIAAKVKRLKKQRIEPVAAEPVTRIFFLIVRLSRPLSLTQALCVQKWRLLSLSLGAQRALIAVYIAFRESCRPDRGKTVFWRWFI